MFIAHDRNGVRIDSLLVDEHTLYNKVKNNEVFCPECGMNLKFRSGTFRPHFYHQKNTDCTYPYGEPESETHIKGKTLLYEWLQKLYPKSQVYLEWKIEETNQRSDVIVIHETGERWAFEFQCTPISENIWLERHYLYKKARVRDFWIMSSNVNKYLYEEDKAFRLSRDLEKAIFTSNQLVYYLDVKKNLFHIIRGGEFETKTILRSSDYFFSVPIQESRIEGFELWCNKMLHYYADDSHINRIEDNFILYEIVSEELEKINIEKQRKEREQHNQFYKALANSRNNDFKELSYQERMIFQSLCDKHQYSLETMPGFFFRYGSSDIETPLFLIQLWLYDQLLYGKSKKPSKHGYPTLWAPNALKALNILKHKGGYRIKKQEGPLFYNSDKGLIDDILSFWNNIGIIKRIGYKERFYFRISCDYLPPHKSLKESLFIQWDSQINGFVPVEVEDAARQYKRSFQMLNQ